LILARIRSIVQLGEAHEHPLPESVDSSCQQQGCLLTRKQWKTLRDWAGKVPTSVVRSAGELARLLLSSILK
jgi:hypothetical protein